MSYDIRLIEPVSKETIRFPNKHFITGGTYAMGGTDEAWLNITYNYGDQFRKVFGEGGICSIYGKTGAESIPLLEKAISQLNDETDSDYWKSTEGNAKKALHGLLAFARLRPDGVWEGD
jgi:hypothetical protein